MTVKEIMHKLGLEKMVYDTAYPVQWANAMRELGISNTELQGYVWIYEPGDHFGKPFNYIAAYGRYCLQNSL